MAFLSSAPLLFLWPLAPPPQHNEQLVENLHFMKIGWKDKGVCLCCPSSLARLGTVPALEARL